jgi:hypothetical protein
MKKQVSRLILAVVLMAVAFAGLGFQPAQAKSDDTFKISVYHGIDGRRLGLSRDLPVIASVYKDGAFLADIPLSYKDRFTTFLPAGVYTIKVTSLEAGPLPSMTIDSAAIPAGVEVRLRARLNPGKIPVLAVKIK